MAIIDIKLKNGRSKLFKLKSIPIFQIDSIDNKRTFKLPFLSKNEAKNKPVFYLKVNRLDEYTYVNLRHWLNIVSELNADYYIICDNVKLENRILRKIIFKDSDIKFIKSKKNKMLKKIVRNIASPDWYNAAYAHLTTFYHAKIHGFEEFWNIDADDTTFCEEPSKCALALNEAAKYARDNDLSLFSFDMWRSITKGEHWSFGIVFTRNNADYFKLFKETKSNSWIKNYKLECLSWNIDLFFNYLKDYKMLNIKNFYIENLMFFHFGNFLFSTVTSAIYIWKNGYIEFPIISKIYEKQEVSKIPIYSDCVKFDINLNLNNGKNYAYNNFVMPFSYAKKCNK